MLWGALAVCFRGPLLVAPAATLRAHRAIFETVARTRTFCAIIALLGALTIWAGSDTSTLAIVLLILGLLVVAFSVLGLAFPQGLMSIVDGLLPAELDGGLLGWRMLGLVAVIIGAALFMFGFDRLGR